MTESYWNALRNVSNNYRLTDKCELLRPRNNIDEYGGVSNDFRNLGTFPCRFILQGRESNVKLSAGSINIHAEYDVLLPFDLDVKQTDLIVKKNDPYEERTFEIIKMDGAMTEGIFTTLTVKERLD